jgi:predicted transcriptional regulator
MSNIKVHVGDTLEKVGQRFIDAWHRAEKGETEAEHHVTFESWATLSKVLTPKRLELLRDLHRHPAASIADLSRRLRRDYKRVHQDVEALVAAGLIDRDDHGLKAEYDRIETTITL